MPSRRWPGAPAPPPANNRRSPRLPYRAAPVVEDFGRLDELIRRR